MTRPSKGPKNGVAGLLLVAALLAFAVFQVAPITYWLEGDSPAELKWRAFRGFEIWASLGEMYRYSGRPSAVDATIGVGFCMLAIQACAGPFMVGWLSRSRLLWGLMVVAAAMTLVSVVGILGLEVLREPADERSRLGAGIIALFAAPFLHLTGLLLVRKQPADLPGG